MKNPNTLVSLAYIKTNKNPLHVFCNYVLYVLITAPNQSLRMDEIRDKLYSEFGLNMPLQMIQSCTRILRKSGELITLPDGGGYSIKDTTFDAAALGRDSSNGSGCWCRGGYSFRRGCSYCGNGAAGIKVMLSDFVGRTRCILPVATQTCDLGLTDWQP